MNPLQTHLQVKPPGKILSHYLTDTVHSSLFKPSFPLPSPIHRHTHTPDYTEENAGRSGDDEDRVAENHTAFQWQAVVNPLVQPKTNPLNRYCKIISTHTHTPTHTQNKHTHTHAHTDRVSLGITQRFTKECALLLFLPQVQVEEEALLRLSKTLPAVLLHPQDGKLCATAGSRIMVNLIHTQNQCLCLLEQKGGHCYNERRKAKAVAVVVR